MRALDRKLLRDLAAMWAQVLAIALVMAGGVATYVMSASTLDSLRRTQADFYREYRFAEVFSGLKRAPLSLASRIRDIPGVARVQARITAPANIALAGFADPVTGLVASLPEHGEADLNRLYLRRGRLPEPGRDDEAVVSDSFAAAHGLGPGHNLDAVIQGRRRTLRVVGVATSPEFLYQIRPGSLFPDFARYAVLWMGRPALEAAADMEGAFNDLALGLAPGSAALGVLDRLDRLLKPYGGLGAYGRKDQLSHRFLSEEFKQLAQMATVFPAIFLAVAGFLLHVVVGRLVATQREQVAVLKAFGYANAEVAWHYVKLVAAVALPGAAAGIAAGAWLGRSLAGLYMDFYRFPYLDFELRPEVAALAVLVSAAAALAGTLQAVRRAASLPPAEGMRPEPPRTFRPSLPERLGLGRLLTPAGRMILRNIGRRPVKSALSVAGLAMACAIMMVGTFFEDAMDYMVWVQFGLTQREDLAVTFTDPTSRAALHEIQSLPGVRRGEPFRSAPARLRFGQRSYRIAIQGLEPGGDMQRLLDTRLAEVRLPADGLLLTDHLADILGVRPGDVLTVEILEGSRPVLEVPVSALVSQYLGVTAAMDLGALNRRLREGSAISGVLVAADSDRLPEIARELAQRPRVAGTEMRLNAVRSFRETMAEQVLIYAFFNTLLAGSIAFGVVYNTARIALSERSRELASLRVLGYTKAEAGAILLGELAALTLASIPAGFLAGWGLCAFIIRNMQTDLFRVPLVLEPRTFALAAAVVLGSALVSALLVRARLDRLDLVEALKARE